MDIPISPNMFAAFVFCIFSIIENEEEEVWKVQAMKLSTRSESIGIDKWNSLTQGELTTSTYHVHY